jgi:DNA polymerase
MIINEIKDRYSDCKLCPNVLNHTKIFGHGKLNAKIAVCGEGPGKVEIERGEPFVGPAGVLLDQILLSVGINREDVYFTNSVLCRTNEANRVPTKSECKNCRNRLFEELTIVNPKFTLLVGSTALRTVMGEEYKIMEWHGKWITMLNRPCYFYFALLHPAWILHSTTEEETRAKKKTMWTDIKNFHEDMTGFDEIIRDDVNEMARKDSLKIKDNPDIE